MTSGEHGSELAGKLMFAVGSICSEVSWWMVLLPGMHGVQRVEDDEFDCLPEDMLKQAKASMTDNEVKRVMDIITGYITGGSMLGVRACFSYMIRTMKIATLIQQ